MVFLTNIFVFGKSLSSRLRAESITTNLQLSIALFGLIGAQDFCKSFKDHNNSISYVFKQNLRPIDGPNGARIQRDPNVTHFIVDGKYWNLLYIQENDSVVFDRHTSGTSRFDDTYLGAMRVSTPECLYYVCNYALLPKNQFDHINVISKSNNKFETISELEDFVNIRHQEVFWIDREAYWHSNHTVLPYSDILDESDSHTALAIGFNTSFTRIRFEIKNSTTLSKLFQYKIRAQPPDRTFRDQRKIVGLSYQWREQQLGYLLFTQEEDILFFCWKSENNTINEVSIPFRND